MFLDEKTIEVRSGKGGNGLSSFRREKFVPLGGPDGGDGGKGGSVILRANEQYTTLLDMGNLHVYKAKNGEDGGPSKSTGKSAKDLIVDVPCGTLVKDGDGHILADLTEPNQRWIAAKGGRGGLGNVHFVTPALQGPEKATQGQRGERRELHLELKLVADVGLVGFPNAGKSSLVNKISSARPKVGDYPFTTLEPILGIIAENSRSFVVADIPGLIEGASEGKGLGHEFLKHIERTYALLFVIDAFNENAWKNFQTLRKELEKIPSQTRREALRHRLEQIRPGNRSGGKGFLREEGKIHFDLRHHRKRHRRIETRPFPTCSRQAQKIVRMGKIAWRIPKAT